MRHFGCMTRTTLPSSPEVLRTHYQEQGFQIINQPVIPSNLIDRAVAAQDRVIAGTYETGRAPRRLYADAPAGSVIKIDDPQIADRTIHETITDPAIGRLAAAITGAQEYVQVWGVTLLVKPGGDSKTANVGWHQDNQYWSKNWEGDLFTVWLALSDVRQASGPMVFVKGSHQWGLVESGQFFADDMDLIKARFQQRFNHAWEEELDLLPAGGMSLHHKELVHGSHMNRELTPRRSFAIHLRNERSRLLSSASKKDDYEAWLQDEEAAPVIWRAGS